jgi:hypothetical protein
MKALLSFAKLDGGVTIGRLEIESASREACELKRIGLRILEERGVIQEGDEVRIVCSAHGLDEIVKLEGPEQKELPLVL